MYEKYYGLHESPFSLTPDTEFYFESLTHQEALNVLLVAVRNGDGFIKVTGEVGTGKTLLCRKLLDAIEGESNTVYIPNPYMNYNALLGAVVAEMGISDQLDNDNYLSCINNHLIDTARQSKRTVIILDEAQSLPEESLEAIRLLSNLETEKNKLVQIILFGQPELDQILAQSSIRQLRQRIMHAYRLQPLGEHSIRSYIQHRTQSAGYSGPEIFDPAARRLLFKVSDGIPRVINVLCNKAMMLAYASGEFYVRKKHIAIAAADSQTSVSRKPDLARDYSLQLVSLSVLLAAVFIMSLLQ